MNRPTLKDIATRAGVSVSTVSYALNDNSTLPLAASTKARIKAIARELGYVPNSLARSLQARSSRTVGVLLNKRLTTPRYAEIAQGLSEGLADRGFHLALLDGPSAARSVDDTRGGRLEGLVFIGHDDHKVPADLAEQVGEHDVPFGTLDCGPATGPSRWSSVDFDYALGAEQVVGHLVDQGVRTIVHIRPEVTSRADEIRTRAVETAVASRAGTRMRVMPTGMTNDVLSHVDTDPAAMWQYVEDLSRRLDAELASGEDDPDTTALLCSWGGDVETVYRRSREHDGRFRVAALASGILEPLLWPGLSYSRLPLHEAGRVCADLIVDASTTRPSPAQVLLGPALDTGHHLQI
jgi:LacI family transcriptional regulator